MFSGLFNRKISDNNISLKALNFFLLSNFIPNLATLFLHHPRSELAGESGTKEHATVCLTRLRKNQSRHFRIDQFAEKKKHFLVAK